MLRQRLSLQVLRAGGNDDKPDGDGPDNAEKVHSPEKNATRSAMHDARWAFVSWTHLSEGVLQLHVLHVHFFCILRFSFQQQLAVRFASIWLRTPMRRSTMPTRAGWNPVRELHLWLGEKGPRFRFPIVFTDILHFDFGRPAFRCGLLCVCVRMLGVRMWHCDAGERWKKCTLADSVSTLNFTVFLLTLEFACST